MTVYLSTEDLLDLVEDLGVGPVRDLGLLDSAAHRPQASAFGQDAYPDLDTQAAALAESLVRNHSLVDGNTRLGWHAVVVFYDVNDVDLDADEQEAYEVLVDLAQGRLGVTQLAARLATWRR